MATEVTEPTEVEALQAEVVRLRSVITASERARLTLEAEVVRLRERGAKLTANLAGVSQTEAEQAEAASIGRQYREDADARRKGQAP